MFDSGPDTSGPGRFDNERFDDSSASAPWAHSDRAPQSDPFPEDISLHCLKLNIAGVEHRGEDVLTELRKEFPKDNFEPDGRLREFRTRLLHAAALPLDTETGSPAIVRDMIVHDLLGQALTNLTNWPKGRSIRELRIDGEYSNELEGTAARREYLASAWSVRSFIRLAAHDPRMFNILIHEMGQIGVHLGTFPLGVPMSPFIAYELFNAAAANPLLRHEVVRAYQIIGHAGNGAERLFDEFSAKLDEQHQANPRLQAG